MSYSLQCELGGKAGGVEISGSKSYEGGGRAGIDENIPDGSTDLEIVQSLDVSAAKAIVMMSDQDVTVKTNSSATPAETINLKADVPYVWNTDIENYFTNVFATDWTSLFITNNSGETARFQVEAVTDVTP